MRYIVISTGCEENNHELAEEFISYFNGMGYHIPIYKCSKNGVAAYNANGTVKKLNIRYINLGSGKRIIEKGGKLDKKYNIVIGNIENI